MTLQAATRTLRQEDKMTGIEIAIATFMRHMVQRFETLAIEVSALHEEIKTLKGEN